MIGFLLGLSLLANLFLVAAFFHSRYKEEDKGIRPVLKLSDGNGFDLKAYNPSDSPVFVESSPLLVARSTDIGISIDYVDIEAELLVEPKESRIVERVEEGICCTSLTGMRCRPVGEEPYNSEVAKGEMRVSDRSADGADKAVSLLRRFSDIIGENDAERKIVPQTGLLVVSKDQTVDQAVEEIKKNISE